MKLATLFNTVAERLEQEREDLNAEDPYNGNHGDHMVEIFRLASQAAAQSGWDQAGPDHSAVEVSTTDLTEAGLGMAMEWAARQLEELSENGSAQVYAHGLFQLARQFQQRDLGLDDLIPYVRRAVTGNETASGEKGDAKGGDVLKALISGLAGWQAAENGTLAAGDRSPLDLGYLFDLGVAYMQAKGRGESKIESLSDAAISSSPLARLPHRARSGKLALQTLLTAMAE